MINEISPSIFNNAYKTIKEISNFDYLLCYRENRILLKKTDNSYRIPEIKDFAGNIQKDNLIYLFSLNSTNCFLIEDSPSHDDSFVYNEVYNLRTFPEKEVSWVGAMGYQMMVWYSYHKFCGKCGTRIEIKNDERALFCARCNSVIYPKIPPAVIVAITCKDKLLLSKGRNFKGDFYALIAGYVDIGESLEEAVAREVKEEIGIEVGNLKYYKSQPWPFSGSLMVGYFAEADDTQPLKINRAEIAEAGWFQRGKLPKHASTISIAGDMIKAFDKGTF